MFQPNASRPISLARNSIGGALHSAPVSSTMRSARSGAACGSTLAQRPSALTRRTELSSKATVRPLATRSGRAAEDDVETSLLEADRGDQARQSRADDENFARERAAGCFIHARRLSIRRPGAERVAMSPWRPAQCRHAPRLDQISIDVAAGRREYRRLPHAHCLREHCPIRRMHAFLAVGRASASESRAILRFGSCRASGSARGASRNELGEQTHPRAKRGGLFGSCPDRVGRRGGAACALCGDRTRFPHDFRLAWRLAIFIDGIDGTLARAARVTETAATINGASLDLIIDFLTYVVAPVVAVWRSDLMPTSVAFWIGLVVTIASALYFADTRMKTADNWFRGFPALWNVFVLLSLRFSPALARQCGGDADRRRFDVRADRVRPSLARRTIARLDDRGDRRLVRLRRFGDFRTSRGGSLGQARTDRDGSLFSRPAVSAAFAMGARRRAGRRDCLRPAPAPCRRTMNSCYSPSRCSETSHRHGLVAEWLRRGLQILAPRFDSGRGLQILILSARSSAPPRKASGAPMAAGNFQRRFGSAAPAYGGRPVADLRRDRSGAARGVRPKSLANHLSRRPSPRSPILTARFRRSARGDRLLLAPMVLAKLIQAANVRPGERALDVAGGSGYSASVLAGLGAHVVALESDEGAVAAAKVLLAAEKSVEIVAGDLIDGSRWRSVRHHSRQRRL